MREALDRWLASRDPGALADGSMDVIDWLLLRGAGAALPEDGALLQEEACVGSPPDEAAGPREAVPEPQPPDNQRSAARALVATMLCDGRITSTEKELVDAFLSRWRLAPLTRDEIRPWRPSDLPAPASPREVLEAMAALAHVDGHRDAGEWAVVTAFARSWGLGRDDLDELDQRFAEPSRNPVVRVLEALRGLVA